MKLSTLHLFLLSTILASLATPAHSQDGMDGGDGNDVAIAAPDVDLGHNAGADANLPVPEGVDEPVPEVAVADGLEREGEAGPEDANPDTPEGLTQPDIIVPEVNDRERAPPGMERVRVCSNGKIKYANLRTSDPNVIKIDARHIYQLRLVNDLSQNILQMKRRVARPLLQNLQDAGARGGDPPWWAPMVEAAMCLIQERLVVDNQFVFKQTPIQTTHAEPVYYTLRRPGRTRNAAREIRANNRIIARLARQNMILGPALKGVKQRRPRRGRNRHKLKPPYFEWMIPGLRARNAQLRGGH